MKTAVAAAALTATGLGYALAQAHRALPPRRVPLLGLGAAFVFAAQMVNFPVVGGTSGHLIGGTLIAAWLGLPAAIIVMTTVLVAQCFLFADGGVTALGANLFNMAVIAPVVGWAVFRGVGRLLPGRRGQVAAVAFAGWCSTVATVPDQASIHLLIGLGEGAISALVFYAVVKARPEWATEAPAWTWRGFVGYGLLVAAGVALFVAPFACPWPDGLEAVAAKLGFEHAAQTPLAAPLADYALPGIASAGLATALAGLVGTLVVFGLAVLLSRWLVKREPTEAPDQG